MSDSKNPKPPHPPASASADFYKAENYRAEESIGYMMRRITDGRRARRSELDMCEPGSPTYPQWVPLHKLHMGTATTVAELARECQLDTGAMTRLLDRLEAKGLCRRVRSVSDRRVVNIELTDEGRAAARAGAARPEPRAERAPRRLQRSRSGSSSRATCAASSTTHRPSRPVEKKNDDSASS